MCLEEFKHVVATHSVKLDEVSARERGEEVGAVRPTRLASEFLESALGAFLAFDDLVEPGADGDNDLIDFELHGFTSLWLGSSTTQTVFAFVHLMGMI